MSGEPNPILLSFFQRVRVLAALELQRRLAAIGRGDKHAILVSLPSAEYLNSLLDQ